MALIPVSQALRPTLCLFLALLPSSGPAAQDRAAEAGLSAKIDRIFADFTAKKIGAAQIAVMKAGSMLYEQGYGLAQVEHGAKATKDTPFHAASISKQFTACCVAMLALEGKLSLDDDVRKHVPELPEFGVTITLRHLLHHTSGLRDQWELLVLKGWRLDDVITKDDILRTLSMQRELNFAPGSRYLYCNSGYTLLAEVVERVSGQRFREFAKERIFGPLGMEHTHFHDDHEEIVPGRAYSYKTVKGRLKRAVLSYANCGATSLFTTSGDLCRFLDALMRGKVGGEHAEKLRTMMLERGKLDGGKTTSYALGLVHGQFAGHPHVGHNGADAGFRASLVHYPGAEITVAVCSSYAMAQLQLRLPRVLWLLRKEFPKRERKPVKQSGSGAAPETKVLPLPAWKRSSHPGTRAGRFESPELDLRVRVTEVEGKLYLEHPRHGRLLLKQREGDLYRGRRWYCSGVRFLRDAEGRVASFVWTGSRVQNLWFVRIGD